jgi:hypothetical protein
MHICTDRSKFLLRTADVSAMVRSAIMSKTMLMTVNTRTFLPEAAKAASALPCWHKPVDNGSQAGYVLALAERWMR